MENRKITAETRSRRYKKVLYIDGLLFFLLYILYEWKSSTLLSHNMITDVV